MTNVPGEGTVAQHTTRHPEKRDLQKKKRAIWGNTAKKHSGHEAETR